MALRRLVEQRHLISVAAVRIKPIFRLEGSVASDVLDSDSLIGKDTTYQ
jgi:hypothetical protein